MAPAVAEAAGPSAAGASSGEKRPQLLIRLPASVLTEVDGGPATERDRRRALKRKLRELQALTGKVDERLKSSSPCAPSGDEQPTPLPELVSSDSAAAAPHVPAVEVNDAESRGEEDGGSPAIAGVSSRGRRAVKPNTAHSDFLDWDGVQVKDGVAAAPPQKLDARSRNLLKQECAPLLESLMQNRWAWVFNSPVDVEGMGLHDYPLIIKHPMDLGTINSRLSYARYNSPAAFAADVRLVFSNARLYNAPGTDVYTMATNLSAEFERQWRSLQPRLAQLLEDQPVASPRAHPAPVKHERAREHREEPKQLKEHPAEPREQHVQPKEHKEKPRKEKSHKKQSPPPSPPDSPAPKAKTPRVRPPPPERKPGSAMPAKDKEWLLKHLDRVPADRAHRVVEIVTSRHPHLAQQNESEYELDISELSDATLWELHRFVTNCMKSLSKWRKRKLGIPITNSRRPPASSSRRPSKRRAYDDDEDLDIGDELPEPRPQRAVVERERRPADSDLSSSSSDSDSGSDSSSSDSSDNDS
eukprot:jgi/Chlat1/2263/Chrsp17S02572